ncbi:MAG: hypothetical protein WDN26_19675 [Chitinophagaceae bacterium]
MKPLKLLILHLLVVQTALSQADKSDIIRHFDWVSYYPDSTIKSAFHIKDGQFDDYAIFLDSTGAPEKIGKFVNGRRKGFWLKSNGGIMDCNEKDAKEYFPGCGTGAAENIRTFQLTYRMLLDGKNNLLDYLSIE